MVLSNICKFGKLIDYIPEVDVVPPRIILDDATNRHGSVFREFLLDAKCCLVNGRITPEHDTYTFIEPWRGSSIVDYFITSLNGLDSCKACHVFTTLQNNIDNIHSDMCNLYYEEMNKLFRWTDIHPASKKRLHRSIKSFWCDELQIQWKLLCKAESLYLKASGNERK